MWTIRNTRTNRTEQYTSRQDAERAARAHVMNGSCATWEIRENGKLKSRVKAR